jgi:hypothetical protein
MLMAHYVVTLGVMIWIAVAHPAGRTRPDGLSAAFVREERR